MKQNAMERDAADADNDGKLDLQEAAVFGSVTECYEAAFAPSERPAPCAWQGGVRTSRPQSSRPHTVGMGFARAGEAAFERMHPLMKEPEWRTSAELGHGHARVGRRLGLSPNGRPRAADGV